MIKYVRRIFKLLMTAFYTLIIKENGKEPRAAMKIIKAHSGLMFVLCEPRSERKKLV